MRHQYAEPASRTKSEATRARSATLALFLAGRSPLAWLTSCVAPRSFMTNPTNRSRPLEGIHVLDLSRFIAGPYIGRLLADLGADVVKLEPPEGDGTHQFGVVRDGLAGLYVQQNAGKRNVG